MTKYIFVTGGVVSSLGKGITAASLGMLLKERGFRVTMQKLDPYLNVDPGTMNPYQHGEVFVTDDGAETDLDLGHYERFIDESLTHHSSVSSGQIYQTVIQKERRGDYNGNTVQVIPHVTNEIKSRIYAAGEQADIVIVEVGGTVGDIEGQPFLEAFRQLRFELGPKQSLFIHVTLVPYLAASQELKTKPTQHSVKELQETGIQPHDVICRTDYHLPRSHREKIALFCNVPFDHVIENLNCESIYQVPLMLSEAKFDELVIKDLELESVREPDLSDWKEMVDTLMSPKNQVNIGLVGKYVQLHDAFLSFAEAFQHAGIPYNAEVNIKWVAADDLNDENVDSILGDLDGILVPGGFGRRGLSGKIAAIKYAREKKIPFFGICLGMQAAIIEIMQNLAGLKDANSTEADPYTPHPVIDRMKDQTSVILGGTMRLGSYRCTLEEGSLIHAAYGKTDIEERHRHRYEFNIDYEETLTEAGAVISGHNPESGLLETMELDPAIHPWFVGVQFHPEFKSRPNRPHPLFKAFVKAALDHQADKPQDVIDRVTQEIIEDVDQPAEF